MRATLLGELSVAFLLACLPTVTAFGGSRAKDAISLSKVKTLTFRHDKLTTSRRVDPVPQLSCVGGSAAGIYNVDVMQCKNSGSEYGSEDIQWTCSASLPPEFKLGSTEVSCEGYNSPDDPLVLKGSCGVEYRLVLTELGEEKYGGRHWKRPQHDGDSDHEGTPFAIVLFWIAFIAVALYIAYNIFNPSPPPAGGPRRGDGGWYPGGGGGGPGDDYPPDDPPPPYSPRGGFHFKTQSAQRPPNYGSTINQPSSSWRPGFWTGAATGATAAYAYANRNASRGVPQQPSAQAGPSRSSSGGSSGFAGPSSFPSPSESRHQSTGFGGTSRR